MKKNLSNFTGMPQIQSAFSGWMNNISIVLITQVVINGFPTNKEQTVNFQGVIQPLNPQALEMKPEGQRALEWLQIHCPLTTQIKINDRILWNGKKYKIMAENDYSLNGYHEFHALKDYTNEFTG